jgi:hypothetical protein
MADERDLRETRELLEEDETPVSWGGPGHAAQEAINEGNADILRGELELEENKEPMAEQGAEPAGAEAGITDRGTVDGEGAAGRGDMLGGLSAGAGDYIGGTKVAGDRAEGIEPPQESITIDMTR